jgi:hypothetical protein
MSRITDKDVEKAVERLNTMLGHPTVMREWDDQHQKSTVNRGTYSVEHAYGKCRLCVSGESVNVSPLLTTKRELYYQIYTAINILQQEGLDNG